MKALKLVGYAFGGLSGVYAGYYTVLYLTRWEWQRALISAIFFLIIEVLLATVLLLTRFSRLEDRLEQSAARMEDVRNRLEQTRPLARNCFPWLAPADLEELSGTQRTFVFVPVLVAGAALSGLATVLQKIAGASVGRGAERRLAGRLTALTVPPVGGTDTLEDLPSAIPRTRPGRLAFAVAGAAGGLLLVPLLWSALADATQPRPEPPPRGEHHHGVRSAHQR
ncbi:hypothetical protein ACFV7R_25725 [Streptomyces sp. NPDC059866]|uniref:hypothetical protein n=1 Tax=Streptomyces sp. NPDC059866 TaxID=3346978 RepID=UPI0036533931